MLRNSGNDELRRYLTLKTKIMFLKEVYEWLTALPIGLKAFVSLLLLASGVIAAKEWSNFIFFCNFGAHRSPSNVTTHKDGTGTGTCSRCGAEIKTKNW